MGISRLTIGRLGMPDRHPWTSSEYRLSFTLFSLFFLSLSLLFSFSSFFVFFVFVCLFVLLLLLLFCFVFRCFFIFHIFILPLLFFCGLNKANRRKIEHCLVPPDFLHTALFKALFIFCLFVCFSLVNAFR